MTRFTPFACVLRAWLVGSLAAVVVGVLPGNRTLAATVPTLANAADPAERIRFLRAEIARHDELYYRKAQPEIGDADYDRLKRELTALDEQFPEEAARLGPTPVAPIGDDRTPGFAAYRHGERMLSLDKTYSEAGLREFCARLGRILGRAQLSYVIEPKFDGLAVSAIYERGRLVRLVTRGDGAEGDDVTVNAGQIRSLPSALEHSAGGEVPDRVEVRGEVYLSFAEFDRLNREREEAGEVAYASPRNLAVATLKSPEPQAAAGRRLDVVFYGVGAFEPAGGAPISQQALLDRFRAWGLPTVGNAVRADSADAVCAAVREIGRTRGGFAYPTDGAVVKLDSVAGQRELGRTGHAPRWAIAYKFAPERAATRLKAITIQVGRTGVLTPVAELEPVRLGGAVIGRATLHNAAEIGRRDIRVGDRVFVERTGEVIPAVVGVDLTARDAASAAFVFPANCPACGSGAVRREGEIAWRCTNRGCPAQVLRRLLHFASAEGVAIKGLREGTINKLVDRGLVNDLADLYRLRREDLLALGRNNQKSSETLIAAIAATKHAELWRFISGFGIPGVGEAAAKALADRFGRLEALAAAREEDLRGLAAVGAETSRSVRAYFADAGVRQTLAELSALGVVPRTGAAAGGRLAGRVFVFTGTFPIMSRARAIELVEAAGGKVSEGVSRRTSFVVAGAEPGAKLARARELGIAVIDDAELQRMVRVDSEE